MQTPRLSKTNIILTRVGLVIAGKIRLYKHFPIQDVILYTRNVIQVVGAKLVINIPPDSDKRNNEYKPKK